jgi:GNAT superfamily N-acetyltransferase
MLWSDPFTLRQARTEDVSALLACLLEAFVPFKKAYAAGAFERTVLTPQAAEVRVATMLVMLAFAGTGELAGTLTGDVLEPGVGHLRGMAVRPAWQGSGVADALLKYVEAALLARGCLRVTLGTTSPLARAGSFYKKRGYVPTGRTSDFYGMPLAELQKVLR